MHLCKEEEEAYICVQITDEHITDFLYRLSCRTLLNFWNHIVDELWDTKQWVHAINQNTLYRGKAIIIMPISHIYHIKVFQCPAFA